MARFLGHAGLLAACMATLPCQEATPLERLRSDQAAIRIAALADLAKGKAGTSELEAVAARLGDDDESVRLAAVTALIALRQDLAPVEARLREIVAEGDVGWDSAVGLGGRALVRNVDRFVADLEHADAARRANAVVRICQAGPGARKHQDALLAIATDPAVEVRLALVKHLHQVDWNAAIRTTLNAALKDVEPTVRAEAARSLGVGHDEPEVVEALRTVVQDPEPTVRSKAIEGIGRCTAHGGKAADDVLASLRDRAASVRIAALGATASLKLDDQRAIAAISRCLEDGDAEVLAEALRTVYRLSMTAAWPRAMELTRHPAAGVRVEAVGACARIAAAEQHGATALRLVEALSDEAESVRSRAATALGHDIRR